MAEEKMLFKLGKYEFELRYMVGTAIYLKNKQTGRIVPVMLEGTYHRDGLVLGSTGYTDPEGSFQAEFAETEDCYYGHEAVDCYVIAQRKAYPKCEWDCVLRPGDQIMLIHIPQNSDISTEYVMRDIAAARAYVRENYPDWDPVALHSGSWLFDPVLADMIGKESKIVRFGDLFIRYPILSPGTSVFSFVFHQKLPTMQKVPDMEHIAALPENTRLERGIKQLYLDGKAVLNFNGAIFW